MEIEATAEQLVPGDLSGEMTRQLLIEQHVHRPSNLVRVLKKSNRLVLRYRREGVKKFIDVMATLEIVKQVSQRDARADEHRSPSQDFRVAMHNR
jgi:hypothetical protein